MAPSPKVLTPAGSQRLTATQLQVVGTGGPTTRPSCTPARTINTSWSDCTVLQYLKYKIKISGEQDKAEETSVHYFVFESNLVASCCCSCSWSCYQLT